MKVLAEIPPPPSPGLRAGTLRRRDLEAFAGLLRQLEGTGAVTMTGVGPGRRAAVVGLAAAAAARGTHTALLECDLVEPGLADALGLANAPGLHEYLRGAAVAEDILRPVVLAGPGSAGATEPLVCVVAGRPADAADAAALLGSARFRHAVSNLRDAYGLLLIDGPPAGRDAELLAAMAAADLTIAWRDRSEATPDFPGPVSGLVVPS